METAVCSVHKIGFPLKFIADNLRNIYSGVEYLKIVTGRWTLKKKATKTLSIISSFVSDEVVGQRDH